VQAKLSSDGERAVLAEMSRLDAARREQTTSRCDELQQQLARLTELTERCHGDSITQMTPTLQQQMLACTDTVSVASLAHIACTRAGCRLVLHML